MVFFFVWYIYRSLVLMALAKKTNTANAWLAWVPVADFYLMLEIGGLPGWYMVGLLVIFMPFFGSLLFIAGMVFLWWKIAESVGRPGWWVVFYLVYSVHLIIRGVMAWGSKSSNKGKARQKR